MRYDVVVLGAGPGGSAAARMLAVAGKKVALVEAEHWGGTCLNCGCIPTKMLLGAVAPLALAKSQERLKVLKAGFEVDFSALQARISRFLKGSSQTLGKTLAGLGVDLILGRGRLAGKGLVQVETADGVAEHEASAVIVATGSSSASFPGLAPDGDCVLDSTGALNLAEVPESLIIVGAGAIGLEMGDFYAAMGTKVTIVEAAPHIAPTEDEDIAKEMFKAQKKAGRTCIEGVMAKSLVTKDGQAELELADGRVLRASKALVAVGRKPNSDVGLESVGASLNRRGFVVVDSNLEAAEGVYAIGDVNGRVLLAHAAEHQAAYVVSRILGKAKGSYDDLNAPIPSCIYGSMEIMRVGKSAKELLAAGRAVQVSSAPLTLNPIAQASGATAGFVKVVWSDGKMEGIAAIGHGVSHLVSVAELLLVGGYDQAKLEEIMIAHPTLDEIVAAAIRAPKVDVAKA